MNKDIQALIESYNQVVKNQVLEESLFDRLKVKGKAALARGSQMLNGRIGNPGDYAYTKNKEIINTHRRKIRAALEDYANDLEQLEVISPNSRENFHYVSNFILSLVDNMAKAGGKNVSISDLVSIFQKAGLEPEVESDDLETDLEPEYEGSFSSEHEPSEEHSSH